MRSIKSPSWINRLLGQGARGAPPHVFALDGRRLRYACLPRHNGSVDLTEYHEAAIDPEWFLEGPLGGALKESGPFRELLGGIVSKISAPVGHAALVLPDAWLRITFAEAAGLPRGAREREEVLRWKLRRLVPFRVEDLRVDEAPVTALTGRPEDRRVLLLFGVDALLGQLEEAFAAHGVTIGYISNESLALLAALESAIANLDLATVAHVTPTGYSLVFTRHGEPAFYRFKATAATALSERLVARDLRLTSKFLSENLDGARLRRVLLVAPRDLESSWRGWLEEVFQVPVTPLAESWAPPAESAPGAEGAELAPLLGAALRET